MYRNLHARVEALCPIYDRVLKEKMWTILQAYWNDSQQTWTMKSDASYEKKSKTAEPSAGLSVQEELMRLTKAQQLFNEDDFPKEANR